MATVHMSESEVAHDFAGVLEKVRSGAEIVVERDHRPVAVIRSPRRSGRPISECIASAKASGSKATFDEAFARDVEEGIRERQRTWNPPSWE
jgi:antitoxin (DNA-binding transcriptional repressor) of toxin-antitoxin stability system